MNKAYSIQGCDITVSDGNRVTFSGILLRTKQLEELEKALREILELTQSVDHLILDFVECEECISMLLKPVLIWVKEVVNRSKSLTLHVGSEDDELLPWHETIVDRIEYFNSSQVPVTIEKQEL
ncbi:MAG: hypothetical protein HQL68_05535 [Magnetococcales bacterium]|nr:hypothetical protein [Magnetococcales bacterium]